jgi:Tol biopolymer transport system component
VAGGRLIGGPAISSDGKRIAFTAEERGRTRLYVMNADGSGVRTGPESLQPRGAPAWSPDGNSLAVAATFDGKPQLVRLSVADQKVTSLVADFAADPVWSPDGSAIVFSGREVGTTFPIRAAGADGKLRPQPTMMLSRGVRRVVFLPGQNSLVVLRGDMVHKDFWAIDLDTGHERRLTNFGPEMAIGDFDVSPDGSEIVFGREQDNSDIGLIER